MMKKAALCLSVFVCMLLALPVLGIAASDPEPFIVGKVRVTALQDMPGEMKLSIFTGVSQEKMESIAPSGSVPAGVTVFLIQDGRKNILVDTGYGLDSPERKSALPNLLQRLGLTVDAIDAVLLTHMHGDHIGGLVRDGKPVFPNADVLVGKVELTYWTADKTLQERERNAKMARDVVKAYGDKLKLFEFGETIVPGIVALAGIGHTPGHTLLMLSSGDAKILFWGDLVHGAALQFPMPEVCANFDMNKEEAVEIRRKIFASVAAEKILVAGAHLPFPAIGRVTKSKDGEGYTFQSGI